MKTIVAVLALACAALGFTEDAFAAATWRHFNADPAYQSREAAIADAPQVLRRAGYPEPIITLLTEAMKRSGTRTHVTNGMNLDFMRTGKNGLWRNVDVKFEKPPRQQSMEYSAPSEEWTVVDAAGMSWTVGIPDVCNNTYGRRPKTPSAASQPQPPAQSPPVTQEACTPDTPRTLVLNAWCLSCLPEQLRNEAIRLIGLAENRDAQNAMATALNKSSAAYRADDVSRTLGKALRTQVVIRAPVAQDIKVQLRDPKSLAVVQDLGVVKLKDGVGRISFTKEQREKIIETIWPTNFVSPTVSNGLSRLWFFEEEWKTGDCREMNEHGLIP